jgi:phosphoribosylformylglycinamidine synthase
VGRKTTPSQPENPMKAKITITLKNGVLDPQGAAIESALAGLGFDGAQNVRQGKVIEMKLAETNEAAARAKAEEMCKKLLANPVMENYAIEIVA